MNHIQTPTLEHRYVTFILGSISLLYLFVNLSLCYDWPMRDKGPSVYYTGSTGSCGEMYFNETCFTDNKEHVYVYYRWHIGFHALSCIGFFTGFTMLKSRRCRSRVFNFETQRESNLWQYYAFCLNLYVANVYMELHNFLVQEYVVFERLLLWVLTRITYITHNFYHCHFHISPNCNNTTRIFVDF